MILATAALQAAASLNFLTVIRPWVPILPQRVLNSLAPGVQVISQNLFDVPSENSKYRRLVATSDPPSGSGGVEETMIRSGVSSSSGGAAGSGAATTTS